MWKVWDKFKRKKKGFSGFKVELYRDGQLLLTQKASPDQILSFDSKHGPVIMDGVRVHGYTLTPHLENNQDQHFRKAVNFGSNGIS